MVKEAKTDLQAAQYTHSVWSGATYSKPMTAAELAAESMRVLRNHPTISKLIRKDAMVDEKTVATFNGGGIMVKQVKTDQGYEHVLAYKRHVWECEAYGIRKPVVK